MVVIQCQIFRKRMCCKLLGEIIFSPWDRFRVNDSLAKLIAQLSLKMIFNKFKIRIQHLVN